MEVPHQGYKRARATVSSDNRSAVRTAKWILGVVGDSTCEKTPVEIKKI